MLATRNTLRTTTGLADELVELLSNSDKANLSVAKLQAVAEDFSIINDKQFTRLVKDKIISGDVDGNNLREILKYRPMKFDEKIEQVSYTDSYPILGNHQFTAAVCFRLLKPCRYYATLYITIGSDNHSIHGIYYTESYTSGHNRNMVVTENVYDDLAYIVKKLDKFRRL